jgi:mono/diheme cytochrome c family protein
VNRLVVVLLVGFAAGWPGRPRAEQSAQADAPSDRLRHLLAAGERLWTTSPDPGNPVACATCHRDPDKTRGWAASFPKFKPLPPPHARVMTLLQANAEAVERHYRLADPLAAATAITAYLTAHGADVPISPGISAGQPTFPARMRALAESVHRGERLFARRCVRCHEPADIAPTIGTFPRLSENGSVSAELFLERHLSLRRLSWDGGPVADVIAYLMSNVVNRPIGYRLYDGSVHAKEGS